MSTTKPNKDYWFIGVMVWVGVWEMGREVVANHCRRNKENTTITQAQNLSTTKPLNYKTTPPPKRMELKKKRRIKSGWAEKKKRNQALNQTTNQVD